MAWRNCNASNRLLEAVNAINPRRSKASDGTIGDQAHASRGSDHNPNKQGVVRARDITRAGLDLPAIFEALRRKGAAGDRRLTGGGYLILDRRITTPDFSGWRRYTGSNPHVSHGHVSFSRDPAGYDSNAPWDIFGGVPQTPTAAGALSDGSAGDAVRRLQMLLTIKVDGQYGPATEAAVRAFQQANGLTPDGVCGPATWRALEEDDMNPEEREWLRTVYTQLIGPWETWRHGVKAQENLTLVDLVRGLDREVNSLLSVSEARPGDDKDSLYGQVLSARAEGRDDPETP